MEHAHPADTGAEKLRRIYERTFVSLAILHLSLFEAPSSEFPIKISINVTIKYFLITNLTVIKLLKV